MRRAWWLAACVVCGCASAPPVHQGDARSGVGAGEALREYAALLRAVHPAPWRFITPEAFDALVEEEAGALAGEQMPDELRVAQAFQRVAASLKDAHLAIALESYQPGVRGAPSFLPLLCKQVEGVWRVDAASEAGLVGQELVAINHVSVAQIVARISPLVIADGVGEGPRARLLDRDFARLYHLAYGLSPAYAVQVRGADGEVATVDLVGQEREVAQALRTQRRSAPVWGEPARELGQLPFTLNVLAGVRWVRMPSFGNPDMPGYKARVATLMEVEDGARAVVIDLRGNEGGLRPHGMALTNYLIPAPYAQWRAISVRARAIPERFKDRVSGAFGVKLDALGGFPAPDAGGVSRVEEEPLASWMQPAEPQFAGPVIVLADGLTNSAANELIMGLKHARPEVVLVGEEVGGGCADHVGELPALWRTPGFGVVALLSLIHIEHVAVEGCEPGRGLMPDVPVVYTQADFEAGRDPYLEAVRGVLAR
jgi:C-terminal processing protease CtpA/Prc